MNNKALEVLVDNLHDRVVRLEVEVTVARGLLRITQQDCDRLGHVNARDVHDLRGQLHDLEEYLGIEYQPPAMQPARYVKKAARPPKGGYGD